VPKVEVVEWGYEQWIAEEKEKEKEGVWNQWKEFVACQLGFS
jgi:hypothetical protein